MPATPAVAWVYQPTRPRNPVGRQSAKRLTAAKLAPRSHRGSRPRRPSKIWHLLTTRQVRGPPGSSGQAAKATTDVSPADQPPALRPPARSPVSTPCFVGEAYTGGLGVAPQINTTQPQMGEAHQT